MAKKDRAMNQATIEPYREKPTARIRLGKDMKLPALRVGKPMTVELTGRITNVDDDEFSRGFAMQITGIETEKAEEPEGMGAAMSRVKRSRTLMDSEF